MGDGNATTREYRQRLIQQIADCMAQWERVVPELQDQTYAQQMREAVSAVKYLLNSHGVELPSYSPQKEGEIITELPTIDPEMLRLLQELPDEAWNWTWRHAHFGLRTLQWWVERSLALVRAWLVQFSGIKFENKEN